MFKAIRDKRLRRSALGAALAVLVGLLLWGLSMGEPWTRASYDYLFRFGSRSVSNNVVLLHLDNESYDHFKQVRGQPWDRRLHARLLHKLAEDGCSMVVFDAFFRKPGDPIVDAELAEAIRRPRAVVLMAEQARLTHPDVAGARPVLPTEPFLSAATDWGVAWLDPDLDSLRVVRRHWPFPAPGPYPSLPRTAARIAGVDILETTHEPWLRYYRSHTWSELSYRLAFDQAPGFFRDKVVFIGSQPKTSLPDGEPDEFATPFTRWTGEAMGGVEILITSFLNLQHKDWLRRWPVWLEALLLVATGVLLGGGLCRLSTGWMLVAASGAFLLFSAAGIIAGHASNYWFPWLVIPAGQLPVTVLFAAALRTRPVRLPDQTVVLPPQEELPMTPGYELFPAPFGQGAYGKVWLARKPGGPWEALKVVYRAKFENSDPFDREFKGVSRYCQLSEQHPGLLRVNFVSERMDGFFYYVMELGDAVDETWQSNPSLYKPKDLVNLRAHLPGNRLPTLECVELGIKLCQALEFLHRNGLAHRDIKPQNILFVNNEPKLADVGLIAEFRPDDERTLVGTPGYMPPAPEIPGTPAADIYALGIVLYVLSSGGSAALFPEISSTLVASRSHEEFSALNSVIIKACHPDLAVRYSSATEMLASLQAAKARIETSRGSMLPP